MGSETQLHWTPKTSVLKQGCTYPQTGSCLLISKSGLLVPPSYFFFNKDKLLPWSSDHNLTLLTSKMLMDFGYMT
jgi:hypothetical protein